MFFCHKFDRLYFQNSHKPSSFRRIRLLIPQKDKEFPSPLNITWPLGVERGGGDTKWVRRLGQKRRYSFSLVFSFPLSLHTPWERFAALKPQGWRYSVERPHRDRMFQDPRASQSPPLDLWRSEPSDDSMFQPLTPSAAEISWFCQALHQMQIH